MQRHNQTFEKQIRIPRINTKYIRTFVSSFRMCRLKNCCCCADLEIGGKIWGGLGVIIGAIYAWICFSSAFLVFDGL